MTPSESAQFAATRARNIARLKGCSDAQIKAAGIAAENLFADGACNMNNAINRGVKVALRWKRKGIAVTHNNIIPFPARAALPRPDWAI